MKPPSPEYFKELPQRVLRRYERRRQRHVRSALGALLILMVLAGRWWTWFAPPSVPEPTVFHSDSGAHNHESKVWLQNNSETKTAVMAEKVTLSPESGLEIAPSDSDESAIGRDEILDYLLDEGFFEWG
ncbi:MAG: hypothetical protein N2050_01330 [Flavobacteriales bacterium]|nr:hypothetical protein [Flavobacteriales bacterium]MCX7649180.1 hypothetical protein [Flavobacteriales bacterium]MDW8432653.1 hypothetical protein [Flavobacteriales bacterium]